MIEAEFQKEIQLDFLDAFRFSDRKDQWFRRQIIKSRQFPVRRCLPYTSPRKNKWLILFEARSKKEHGDMSRINFVCYVDSPHGYYAFMPSFMNEIFHLVIYPPHFFSRFSLRCGVNLTGVKLMTYFFERNCSYVYDLKNKRISEDAYEQEVYGSTLDGVALGIATELDNILFRTFITYEMTKGEQVEKFANNEQIRKEIHEGEKKK
ncbi:hypothetical protein DMA11_10360 [Marinilabiliaceae bacterium JC017]|nr:hypothetical protein DMA11_10360 [Marinilabiliaceae bacterium JC017]